MTSHNSFFGWLHSIKLGANSAILGGSAVIQSPYPAIIPNPSWRQIMKNWNAADTGLFVCSLTGFTLLSFRLASRGHFQSILSRRKDFFFMVSFSVLTSFLMGSRNSYYRLQGLVPNGLRARKMYQPVKYNYTSEFLNNSFLSFLVQGTRRPIK